MLPFIIICAPIVSHKNLRHTCDLVAAHQLQNTAVGVQLSNVISVLLVSNWRFYSVVARTNYCLVLTVVDFIILQWNAKFTFFLGNSKEWCKLQEMQEVMS
jgi:hypothetical protein